MRVAMAQISSSDAPDENLVKVIAETRRAAAAGADLIVFPEAAMCRFGVPLAPIAEPLDGPWASAVDDVAQDLGIAVVAGMFTPARERRVANTLLVAVPGEPPRGYDKIHLYDAFGFQESRTVAPGHEPLTFEVAGTVVGVATCYDIRFPALFTELARRGAQLITVPASWGAGPGKLAQWQLLASARALDTAAFVAAVGQAEPSDPRVRESGAPTGIGHSRLSDPFGTVIADYEEYEFAGVHDIDLALADNARATFGVLDNERVVPRGERGPARGRNAQEQSH